jgi:hypothetical protein
VADDDEQSEPLWTWVDTVLSAAEGATVILITVGIFVFALYFAYWIVFGPGSAVAPISTPPEDTHTRLLAALKTINDNWKAGLLLTVPLLYRFVRRFLERVRRVGPLDGRPRTPREAETIANPEAKPEKKTTQ